MEGAFASAGRWNRQFVTLIKFVAALQPVDLALDRPALPLVPESLEDPDAPARVVHVRLALTGDGRNELSVCCV